MMRAPMPSIDDHLRATSALMRILHPDARLTYLLARRERTFEERRIELVARGISVRARELVPSGLPVGAVMIAHGMHHLGGDEPRLLALASALARAGLRVLVPHLPGLAAYRLDPAAVDEVSAASEATARRIGRNDVGVVGISLGGGIALIAATDPELGASIRFVLGIGAHDDLARLARWFGGDSLYDPDGLRVDHRPDPYGLELLLHDSPQLFFGEAAKSACEALVPALEDRPDEALERSRALDPRHRAYIEAAVLGHEHAELTAMVRQMIEARRGELEALSPSARLGVRRLPVLLLHGRDDRLIPASESLYLMARLGRDAAVMLTGALGHADRNPDVGVLEQLALIRFVARVFTLAR